ncbi:MAG TPA: DUF2306 domain-containing protein [Candidatus Dormibacteraeota bacterium]|jgi:uncharacterized membrane protein|nr:DUF2306 domain-containing protein [Candidatus Dormibacteraeota bacterium]
MDSTRELERVRPARTSGGGRRSVGWVVMTVMAVGLALYSARYFSLNSSLFLPAQKAVYLAHLGPLLLHVGGGVVALALGPWQFARRIRSRHPRVHRWTGRIYLTAALTAGAGGLLLAPLSLGGPLAHGGFAALAILMLLTTARAYLAIRRGQIAVHRAWMTRSYALIFTAVTFRTWLGLAFLGLPYAQVYAVGAWVSWLINLYLAELLIARLNAGANRRSPAGGTG